MAFDPNKFANDYLKSTTPSAGGFDPNKFVANYTKTKTLSVGGFDPNKFASRYGVVKSDLKSSQGLYNLASQNGLQDRADQILKSQSGESNQEIFSGGFISDIFDGLNALQYGTVGLLKGKSFSEGVKTRQSFSDKDALGDKGIPGVIAGIVLDIAFDPLTYIAPATILKKIPYATKLLKASKEATFGKMVEKGIEGTEQTYQALEGGTRAGKYLASKFTWMFGADPVFKETFERSTKNIAVETQAIAEMGKSISRLDRETAAKLLTKDETGRLKRIPLGQLEQVLKPEEFESVKKIYEKIDDLGKQAADLGLLSGEKYEENIGEYLKNAYTEYELQKGKGLFPSKPTGIKGIKGRVEGLTPERMEELGQINDPAYLLFKSAFDLTKDVENAKMFRQIAQKYGTDVAQEGFTQLPKTARFMTTLGKQGEILGGVKKINTDLKPMFRDLKQTFKADAKVLKEISEMELKFSDLGKLQGEELYKFFNEGSNVTKTVETSRKLGIINEALQPLANSLKKFKNLDEFKNLPEGIQLEKAFLNGDLERNGFKSMEDFFKTVKEPFTPATTKVITKEVSEIPEFTIKGDTITETTKAGKQVTRNMDDIERKLYETKVAKEGLPLKSRIIEGVKPKPTKVNIKELDLIKNKISNFNAGYKFATKEILNNQNQIIKIIRGNFSQKERGQFLTAIKNATTKEKTLTLINDLKTKFDDIAFKADELGATKQISKVVQLQKEIERIIQKGGVLKEIDKRSIDDSFRMLEKNINDLQFSKENLLQNLQDTRLGDLAGKYIPNNIHEYLQDIINPAKDTLAKNIVANFKFFKVVMNPGTHARNIISNKILNYWKLGMNPLDPRVMAIDIEAIREVAKGSGKWIDEARPQGWNVDTFASAELKNNLLNSPEANLWGKSRKGWETIKTKLGNLYQSEENHAKLSAYIFNRKHRNLNPEEAWRAAESATFNYAQVTPFVRKLRESLFGFPFITFTVKSTPVIVETLLKNPNRISVIGKIKQGIEKMSDINETEAERANEPPWVKDGFYVKLPIKDKLGRSSYFDLTYILPFGDIMAGNFFERQNDIKTGLPENYAVSLAKKSPFIQTVMALGKNRDFYGNYIWKEGDSSEKQLRDLMTYLTKTYVPPAIGDQLPGGYNNKGERQYKGVYGALNASSENQQRNLMQELMRNVGAKIQPIDADIQETYSEWNKKKALENLLRENGVLDSFDINYVPKKE